MVEWDVVGIWQGFLKGGKASPHQLQIRAALPEQPGCGPTDAAACTGNEDPLAREGLP
jgi:hypothetical protein